MEKIKELERKKKKYKNYVRASIAFPVLISIFFIYKIGIINIQFVLLIISLIGAGILMAYVNNSKIKDLNSSIENIRLKPDIIKQFGLIAGKEIEIFLKKLEDDDNPTERHFLPEFRQHLKYEGKFYAKLLSEDEVELILKSGNGKTMRDPIKITRFTFLKEHFYVKNE